MVKSEKVQAQEEIKAEHHNALVDDVTTLEEKVEAIPEGKQGAKGEPGPQGPAGKDSEVTREAFDSLVARVKALEETKTR